MAADWLAEGSGFELPVPIVRRESGRFFLISLSPEETSGAQGGIVMLRRRSLCSLNFRMYMPVHGAVQGRVKTLSFRSPRDPAETRTAPRAQPSGIAQPLIQLRPPGFGTRILDRDRQRLALSHQHDQLPGARDTGVN